MGHQDPAASVGLVPHYCAMRDDGLGSKLEGAGGWGGGAQAPSFVGRLIACDQAVCDHHITRRRAVDAGSCFSSVSEDRAIRDAQVAPGESNDAALVIVLDHAAVNPEARVPFAVDARLSVAEDAAPPNENRAAVIAVDAMRWIVVNHAVEDGRATPCEHLDAGERVVAQDAIDDGGAPSPKATDRARKPCVLDSETLYLNVGAAVAQLKHLPVSQAVDDGIVRSVLAANNDVLVPELDDVVAQATVPSSCIGIGPYPVVLLEILND